MGWAEEPEADRRIDFHIPQQRADLALTEFAEQADLTLAVPRDVLLGKEANALIGSYTLQDGVDVLLAGTGLIPEFSNQIVLSIKTDPKSVGEGKTMRSPKKATGLAALLASVFAGGVSAEELGTTNEDAEEFPEELDEIIVTGTNIRGISNSASPVLSFDREAIDATGFSTTEQFIQSLPQNFGGGAAGDTEALVTLRGDNVSFPNSGFGTGANLRGLGNSSTLVLVNGRRLAPAGSGNFVDLSLIPVSAIERIDVLTDGASAIYGSDAVGGVINFILRDGYEGVETRARYGTATTGDADEFRAGVTAGDSWSNGSALLSYDFYTRDPLSTEDRPFSQSFVDPSFLLPNVERNSLWLSVSQEVSPSIVLFVDAYFSDQDVNVTQADPSDPIVENIISSDAYSSRYGGNAGVRMTLSESWQAELVGSYSTSSTQRTNRLFLSNVFDSKIEQSSETWSLDAKADGELFTISGGRVMMAIGGQYRQENFEVAGINSIGIPTPDRQFDRDVVGIFGEVFIPLFGEGNAMPGINRLEITAAGRFEDYSDFGSTTNPKVGLLWAPIDGLNIRGTYGTSFRAPVLSELDNSLAGAILANIPDLQSPPTSLALVSLLGVDPDLGPEDATTWTAGIDIQPPGFEGFNASITYYNIDYKDRIDQQFAFFDALLNPVFEGIVTRGPDASLINEILAAANSGVNGFTNFTTSGPLDAEVVVDTRVRNTASTQLSGLDFALNYSADTEVGTFGAGISGNYIFEFVNQLTPFVEPIDIVDTIFNPADLTLRGNASWSHNGLSVNLFVNYVDSYTDNQMEPTSTVESWTAVDVNLAYKTADRRTDLLKNTTFSISVQNLFDNDPPTVIDFTPSVPRETFDPENASPLGRFVAVEIRKQF